MTGTEVDTLARTIYGEARNQGDRGMHAVANVVMNRVAIAKDFVKLHNRPHPLYGDGTVASACRMRFQFSCWNRNDPNLFTISNVSVTTPLFCECVDIAQCAVTGALDDITGGATHYINLDVCTASWVPNATKTAEIGAHTFFKDVA